MSSGCDTRMEEFCAHRELMSNSTPIRISHIHFARQDILWDVVTKME